MEIAVVATRTIEEAFNSIWTRKYVL